MHGEPLFNEKNENAYDKNTAKNEKGSRWELLQDIINKCLHDDPEERPDFVMLSGEIFYCLIRQLCEEEGDPFRVFFKEKADEADLKAIKFIEKFGTPELVNHKNVSLNNNSVHIACETDRPFVLKALLAKGANPDIANGLQ